MEKLNLETFRKLKQEITGFIEKYTEAEGLSETQAQQFIERYSEIIKILSEHDLSDIDFEEWQGMYLTSDKEMPLDFSKTGANLDFSIINYEDAYGDYVPNFKGCQIKNFDFENHKYNSDMFDEEYRKENAGRFLSENIPEDVSDRFEKGKIRLTDIKIIQNLPIKYLKKILYLS